jgi:hypothetical protein
VGGLYTYNAELIHAYGEIAHFGAASNLAQWQLIQLLKDEVFIDNFIAENSANLKANCQIIMDGLDHIGIPYTKPQVQCIQSLRKTLLCVMSSRQAKREHLSFTWGGIPFLFTPNNAITLQCITTVIDQNISCAASRLWHTSSVDFC